jgi:redox-sensitive bicupin YhaK (pirin superfamily)
VTQVQILSRDKLPRNRFAGVREHRLIMDQRVFGDEDTGDSWQGFESLVYLADARFRANGETGLHDHHEVDVISVMVEGRIHHQGSLRNGQNLEAGTVQVQRAGSEGFSHNEINPDERENRLIQIWVAPEQAGQPADYRFYTLTRGGLTRVYGGDGQSDHTLASHTIIEIAWLNEGQSMDVDTPYLAYMISGRAFANEETVTDGDLFRGDGLTFDAAQDTRLVVVHASP